MKKSGRQLLLLAWLVLLTRLPFLTDGYGSEDDSWGLVLNARQMAASGAYSYSRLPGHPLQEYALSLIPDAGYFTFNFLSALFSVIAVLAFAGILIHFSIKNWFVWSLVFALIPVIWISSTYTIDYVWELAFLLSAWLALLKDRFMLAGLLIGLAVACRMTSVLLVPAFMLENFLERRSLPALLRFLTAAILVVMLFYLPAFQRYGPGFIASYPLPYPSLPKVLYKAGPGVWGLSGLVAVGLLGITALREKHLPILPRSTLLQASIVTFLYFTLFLLLPQKSAFLIPVIPFILLVLSAIPFRTVILRTAFILLFASPLLGGINLLNGERGADPSRASLHMQIAGQNVFLDLLHGPLHNEQSRRRNRMQYVRNMLQPYQTLRGKHMLLCGWWTNQFTEMAHAEGINPGVHIGEFYDRAGLDSLKEAGYQIWFLRETDRVNDERYGMSYTARVGKELAQSR